MKRAFGTALVVAGLLVLADAAITLAWQEPLSALRAGRAQHQLAAQLHRLELAAPPRAGDRVEVAVAAGALARTRRDGQAVAELRIARIGLRTIVVRGTTAADLRDGPGLIAGTPLPGQRGHDGHRRAPHDLRRPVPPPRRPAPRRRDHACACPTRASATGSRVGVSWTPVTSPCCAA